MEGRYLQTLSQDAKGGTVTVAQLIEELQRQPQYLPVKVVVTEIYGMYDETGQFVDDKPLCLTELDAIEADRVSHEGAFILVTSK